MSTSRAPGEFKPLLTTREERGRELARRGGIQQIGTRYVVPSQSQSANSNAPPTYIVDLVAETCTCPDHAERGALGIRCKHIEATYFWLTLESAVSDGENGDGGAGSGEENSTAKPKRKPKRPTQRRNWPVINDVARHELERLRPLLAALCARVPEPDREAGLPGRKPILRRDQIFAMIAKVYTGKSGRTAEDEIRSCAKAGYISKPFQHNVVHSAMEDEELTPILEWLVVESGIPLAVVENSVGHFSQDSTGFSTSVHGKPWREHKYPKGRKRDDSEQDDEEVVEPPLEDEQGRRDFVKVHLTTGVVTHVVTVAKVSSEGDCKRLPEQLEQTAQNFVIKQFSADKAYLTKKCVNAIAAVGAQPLIKFKKNSKNHPDEEGWAAWNDMWALFQLRRQDFLDAYHARSQVETTISMIKKKTGAFVRSKLPTAQANEIYCKVIAHNLGCIIRAIAEFGIESPLFANAVFTKTETPANDGADADGSSEGTVVTHLKLVK
jgi:transposase